MNDTPTIFIIITIVYIDQTFCLLLVVDIYIHHTYIYTHIYNIIIYVCIHTCNHVVVLILYHSIAPCFFGGVVVVVGKLFFFFLCF